MYIMFFSALFTLLAANLIIESKELVCTETGKTKSSLVTYYTVPGKKGASGMKGFTGESGRINELELEKLEGNKFVFSCIHASIYF